MSILLLMVIGAGALVSASAYGIYSAVANKNDKVIREHDKIYLNTTSEQQELNLSYTKEKVQDQTKENVPKQTKEEVKEEQKEQTLEESAEQLPEETTKEQKEIKAPVVEEIQEKSPEAAPIEQEKVEPQTPVEELAPKTVKTEVKRPDSSELVRNKKIDHTMKHLENFKQAIYATKKPNQDTVRMLDLTLFKLTKGREEKATDYDYYRANLLASKYRSLNLNRAEKEVEELLENKQRMFTGETAENYAIASAYVYNRKKEIQNHDTTEPEIIHDSFLVDTRGDREIKLLKDSAPKAIAILENYKKALMEKRVPRLDRNIININSLQFYLDSIKHRTVDARDLEIITEYLSLFEQDSPDNFEKTVEEFHNRKQEIEDNSPIAKKYKRKVLDNQLLILKSIYYKNNGRLVNTYPKSKNRKISNKQVKARINKYQEAKEEAGILKDVAPVRTERSFTQVPNTITYKQNIENRYIYDEEGNIKSPFVKQSKKELEKTLELKKVKTRKR